MTPVRMVGEQLMERAVGYRHGIVPSVQLVPTTLCDIPGVWHATAPRAGALPWDNPAGGVGWSPEGAVAAASGEALERYAAAVFPLPQAERATLARRRVVDLNDFSLFSPQQRAEPGFPHASLFEHYARGGGSFSNVFSLTDNQQWWVPRLFVGLGDHMGHGLATSSGLAAATSRHHALLRALQELVERDALMTTWNHCIAGRQAEVPEPYRSLVESRQGDITVIDATPAYSPHPVALVTGWVGHRGRKRIALGAACRASWAEAVDKAFLEWCQGVLFAGVFCTWHPDQVYPLPQDVTSFKDHAAYYSVHPQRWEGIPLLAGGAAGGALEAPWCSTGAGSPEQLTELVSALAHHGVALYYRDLTGPDLSRIGIYVVRVLSPDLTPINSDHRWPFGGGRAGDVAWRYPWAAGRSRFPNPNPHPIG